MSIKANPPNDVYPSAGKLALLVYMERLDEALVQLIDRWHVKSERISARGKMGRTQLQERRCQMTGGKFPRICPPV